jgi:hypothetical protein
MKNKSVRDYRLLKEACLLDTAPHVLNGILSEIPANWANSYEIGDIITIVNIVKRNKHLKRIRS